jgi:hypothetical protein
MLSRSLAIPATFCHHYRYRYQYQRFSWNHNFVIIFVSGSEDISSQNWLFLFRHFFGTRVYKIKKLVPCFGTLSHFDVQNHMALWHRLFGALSNRNPHLLQCTYMFNIARSWPWQFQLNFIRSSFCNLVKVCFYKTRISVVGCRKDQK